MPKNPWRDKLLAEAIKLLDGSEGHPICAVLAKLSAYDLNVLVSRLKLRLAAEAEAGVTLGEAAATDSSVHHNFAFHGDDE
jgi:hypothetical protein